MKPIETFYKGYRFRSRLEARWAVFFHALGFNFVYEPDGYDLDGIWYLPDFWISDWKSFIEIKPEMPSQENINKCQKLCNLTNIQMLLIIGQPWINEYKVFLFSPESNKLLADNYKDIFPNNIPLEFAEDRKDERVIWLYNDNYGGTSLYVPDNPHPRWGEKYPSTGEYASNIINAFELARKERFNT